MTPASSPAPFSLRSLFAMDLCVRSGREEYLDTISPDDPRLVSTVRNLERINIWLSGIRRLCNRYIMNSSHFVKSERLTVVDLGCGGGGVAAWCARRCAALGVSARIIGIDHDPCMVALAARRCEGMQPVTIVEGNALDTGRMPHDVDWFVSNHFLHHLPEDEIVRLLAHTAQRARSGVIMNDLTRGKIPLVAFSLLCRALRPSGHTYHDGMISILRSFTRNELGAIAAKAGLASRASIRRSGIGHQAIVIVNDRRDRLDWNAS